MREVRSLEAILAIATGLLVFHLITGNRWLLMSAVIIMTIGLFIPALTNLIAAGWMKLAELLGSVMSKIILSIVFFLVLTPIAFLQKLFGEQNIVIKKPDTNTMFTDRKKYTYTAGDLEHPW